MSEVLFEKKNSSVSCDNVIDTALHRIFRCADVCYQIRSR